MHRRAGRFVASDNRYLLLVTVTLYTLILQPNSLIKAENQDSLVIIYVEQGLSMAVNRDKVDLWKKDVAISVDFYNNWFMEFAPKAFRDTRIQTTEDVELALQWTNNLMNIQPETLQKHPSVLPMLRMTTCPPIARDRLIGLAGVSPNLVLNMEKLHRTPPKMIGPELNYQLRKIGDIIEKMSDPDIFVWKDRSGTGTEGEVRRAATIVADRLCG